eukprot:scaffold11242_cov61-Phaeocystis_antarctica.AAC.6
MSVMSQNAFRFQLGPAAAELLQLLPLLSENAASPHPAKAASSAGRRTRRAGWPGAGCAGRGPPSRRRAAPGPAPTGRAPAPPRAAWPRRHPAGRTAARAAPAAAAPGRAST